MSMCQVTLYTRLTETNVFNQATSELIFPWSVVPTEQVPFFPVMTLVIFYLAVGASILGYLSTWRQRRAGEVVLLVAFLFLASRSIRNVPFFLLVAAPIVCSCLEDLRQPSGIPSFSEQALAALRPAPPERTKMGRASGAVRMKNRQD